MDLKYNTRAELQKCQLGTDEKKKQTNNKLNLPQTIPRDKIKIIRKLLAKSNAHNKNRKKAALTLKLHAFSLAMFILILM